MSRIKPTPIVDSSRVMSSSDVTLIRELATYAVESMQEVINWEVDSGRGERPIVEAMRAYVRDARELLERLQ